MTETSTSNSVPANRTRSLLEASGAVLLDEHFVYTSGRHGSVYVNKDAVYPNTVGVSALCALLADALRGADVEVVCGPALGGIILSQWTAHHLGVPAVYAEKVDGGLELRRGYDAVVAGKRVGVVEDVVNTGGSLQQAIAAVRAAGGEPVAAAALCNRGGVTADDLGIATFRALWDLPLATYPADDCPLCRDGVPVNTAVGKGAAFLAAQGG